MATICNINDPNQRKFGKYLFKKLEKLKSFKAEDLKDLTRKVYDEVLANTDNPSQALLYAAMTPYWAAKLVSFNDSMRKSLKADITMANDVSDNIEADDDFTFLKEYLGIGVEADNIIKEQALQNNLEQSMKAQAKVKRKVATIIKRKLIARPTLWTTQGSEVDKDGNVIESEVFHYTALREVLNSMYNQPTYNTDGKLEATLPVVGPVFLKLVQLKEFAKTQKVKNTLPISDDQMVYAMVDKEGNYLSLNTDLEPVAPADGQTPYFQVMTMQDMLANEVPMKNALSVMLYSTNVPLTYYELEAEQKKEIDLVYEREKTILMNAIKYAKENPGEGYDFDIVGGHFGKVLSDKISSFKFDAKNPFNPQIDDSVSSSDGVVTPQFFTYKNKKYYFEAITSKKGVGGIEEKHVNVILDLIFEEVLGQNGEPLTVSQRREALDKFIYTGIGLKGGVLIDNGKDLFIEITKDGKPLIRTKYNANAEFNGVKGQIDLSMKKLVSIDKLDIDTKRRLMFNLFRSLGYYQISKEGINNPDTFKWPYIEVNQDARPVLKYSSDVNYINWIQSSDSFAITNPDEQMAVNPFVIVQPTSDTVTDMISSDKNIVKYAEEVSRRYVLDKSQEAERNAEYAKLEAEASRHKAIPQKITGRENIYGRVDPVTKKPLSSFQLISIGLRTKTTRTKDEYISYGTPKPGDIRWMVGYDNERILVRITDVYLTPGSVLSKNNRFGLNEVSRAEWEERNKKEAWLPGSVNDKLSFNIEYEVVRPEDIKPTAKAKAPASAEKGITTKKGFKLSIDKKGKDQGKADLANAFISHPNTNTSSYKYMQDAKQQGIPVNDEIKPGPGVIAFVSVNGNKKATDKQIQDTYSQAKNIIEAGGTVIMDSTKDANSSWNKSGEGSVQEKLGAPYGQTSKGYNYWGPNPEVTTQAPVSAPVTQTVTVVSEPYGVVVVETNPTADKTQEFVNVIQPQIQAQAYKENTSGTANDMFMYGLRWTRKKTAKKPLNNKSYANGGLPITDAKAKDGYVYDTVDQNGNPLAPVSDLQPIINEIQNALGIDMSDYDAVIGNIYLPGQKIATHRDTTESLSSRKYPVIVYTIGNASGINIYENQKQPGAPSFASDRKSTVPTKNGSIYTFGMDGNGRFEMAHDTPGDIKRDKKFPPITLPNGNVITNYTITLTFRRAADLEPGMPDSPLKKTGTRVVTSNITQPTVDTAPVRRKRPATQPGPADTNKGVDIENIINKTKDKGGFKFKLKTLKGKEVTASVEQIEEARKWYNSHPMSQFFKFHVGWNAANMKYKDDAGDAVALWTIDGIILLDGADHSDLYHEAWHGFSQTFLTQEERSKLYSEVASYNGTFVDYKGNTVKFKDATEDQLEEYLAESFREYVLKKGTKMDRETPVKKNIFQRIYEWLKAFFGSSTIDEIVNDPLSNPTVKKYFEDMRLGELNDYSFNAKNRAYDRLAKGTIKPLSRQDKTSESLSYTQSKTVLETVDSIMSKGIEIFNPQSGGRATVLFSKGQNKLAAYRYVYNVFTDPEEGIIAKLNNEMSDLREKYSDASTVEEKQRIQVEINAKQSTIDLANWTVENFGNLENLEENRSMASGVIFQHMMNSEFISEEEKREFFEDIDETKSSREPNQYSGNPQDKALQELAEEDVLNLVRSMYQYDKNKNVVLNEFGVPKLANFSSTWNYIAKNVSGILDADKMYDEIVVLAERNPVMRQLLNRLGPFEGRMSSDQAVDPIMNKLQTNFWQAFCKTRVPLVQLTFTEENEGEYNVTVGYATGEVAKVKNNWNKAFGSQYTQFVKEKPYDEEAEKKKVYVSPVQLDIVEVMKAFPTKPTSVEQMLRFLNAVGITVTDNSQVRKEIEMSTDIRRSVSFTYERLRELYENGIAVNFIGDMFRAVTLKNKDVLEDQTHLLNRLANLEARYGDTVTNFMSSNAKGDTQFEHSLNSSLTRFIYEFNESNSQSELVNMAHMNHLDPKRNPFTRGKRSLWQYSLYDPTKNGERRVTADGRTVSLRFENMSGIKGIDKFGEEIGVKTSEADPIGKLLLDFHSAVLRGTPEVMTHSDKSSTYSESLTKVYNPFAGSRKLQDQRYIDDADFMIDESESFVIESPEQVSRGQRMFFKILSNYLYSEMQRMKICRDIVTNQKKDNLEFDYNYAKRGSDFVMFDDILSKDTKAGLRKMLNMVNQDNIENKGLDFYQFLEEYVPELAEKVEKEITNYLGKQTAAVSKRINDANFIDSKITMSVKRNLQQKTKGNDPLKDEVRSFEFTTEDFNEAAIISYVANSWIHNMETVINVYGDIAQYAVEKDEFHKRNSGFSSTGDIARTDRAAIDFVNQIGNSYSRSVNNEYGKPFADTFIEDDGSMSTAVMEDTEHTATYYDEYYKVFFKYYLDVNKGDAEKAEEDTKRSLKNYVNYKEGDGQAWMTFDMYRKTLILFGKWDWNEQEKLFQDIVAGKNVSLDKIAKFFPVKKFQYQGPLKGKGLPVMAMHKFSVVPLIPNVIKDTNLEKLHFRMMEKGIGYAMYKSASKVGTITDNSGDSDKFYTEKGKLDFDRNGKFVRNQIFLHYLKDQLETGEEFKGRIVIPTQMRKLIIEGLVANGVPIDYGKGMSVDERVKSWEALSEKEKLKYPKYAKFKKYEDLLFELTEGKYMELLEKINWTYDGKTKRPNGKIEDLINYVVRNLERQDIAMHELDFIKVHKGKLLVDLSVSFSAEQIEKMLNALVVKELIRQKIKGEPLIQVAKSGWEKPTDEQLRIYGEDLPFYRPGKKKTSAMKIKIALQGDFRKLLNLDDVKELAETAEVKRIANNLNYDPKLVALNMKLKDDNWLDTGDNRRMVTMIGCRIPVQGLNSMEFMEIYEFLPENAGNIIIMPREIVGKTGSDFDIDKMFTMMPNIYSKYGITRYIGYQPKLSTVKRNKLLARENEIAEKVMSIRDKYKDIFDRRDKNNEFAYTDEDKMQIKAFKDEYYATRKKLLDDFYAAESLQNSLDNGSIPADRAEEIYLDYHQARTELFTYEEEFADRMALLRSQLNDKKYVELRNRMKKELEPYNRELVDIAVQMESTTTKGIENELMTSMREILEDPENFIGMMRPNSTEIFEDLAEEMAPFASDYNPTDVLNDEPVRLNPKNGKPTISGTRIFEIPFNIYKRNTNSVGKAVLGIGAVENTYNVLYNRIGMYLNPTSGMSVEEYYSKRNRMDEIDGILARQREKIPFEERISKKEIQKLKDERLELKAQVKNFGVQEIYLPHNTMEKDGKTVISLSDIYTKDGKHKIADIISQMINGWVDVAKDAWIFNVQGNKEVAPTLLLMIEAGVPIEHAVYFVSQPLIRKYIERQRQKKSVWAAAIGTAPKAPSMFKYESKKEILDEFGIVKSRQFTDKNTGEVVKYLDSRDQFDATRRLTSAFKTSWQDPKALRDRLDGFRNQEQEQFSDFDKAVLLHFLELEDMASASQKFKLTTNVDTSRARSLFEASAKEYAISDLKSEGRIPSEMVDKIAEDTAISSFFNALEYQQEIWSPYFKIRDSKQVKEFIHGILRGPLRNEILENTYGNDANGVRKFVQMFLNDLMAYLFQKKLYDFDMVSMKSFKGFNEESIKSKKVVPLAYLQHGVFFEGDKMYIDRNQLAKDYQNLDKLDKEYPVAPVTRSMFPRENQYFKFVIEREFIRSTKDFQAIEKTGHYQNRFKAISNKQATLPEDKRKLMAYEETIRDIALMNTYNMGFMFNGTSNTSMGDILEGIKARHKSLRRQFEILDSLTLFKHSMLSNIRLIDSPKDSDTISLYNEQIKQLMNPDNLNIDAPQEEKEFIANFFQKMPFYSLLQSGYDTNTSFSLQRIMPWESYVNIMSPVFKELTKEKDAKEFTTEFLEDYFNQFYSQNSVQNMKKRNRVKTYNKSSTVSYKEMLFPEDASLARIGIEGNNSMSVSYDYNGKPLFKMGSVSISGMSKQQAEKTIEEYYENIRSLIKNNPNLVFVYNDVFDDTIGTPLKAAKQNDWVLKRLQAEFPENIIGLPTRRVYSESSSQSMINQDEYDDFIDALFRRIDLMKAMEKQGKTLVFNKMGYGQILIGANDATTKLPEKKPMPKTISPDAFDDVSQALLTNFGFLNPNYQDMEGIKAYQKKIVTVQDILDQINVCFTK